MFEAFLSKAWNYNASFTAKNTVTKLFWPDRLVDIDVLPVL